jgi:hypothetical protein
MWSRYGKAIVALLTAAGTAVSSALLGDNAISSTEWVNIIIQTATIAGVWSAPTVPQWPWAKTVIAGVLAAANLAATTLADGPVTVSGWINIALAGIGVLLVSAAPAEPTVTASRTAQWPRREA